MGIEGQEDQTDSDRLTLIDRLPAEETVSTLTQLQKDPVVVTVKLTSEEEEEEVEEDGMDSHPMDAGIGRGQRSGWLLTGQPATLTTTDPAGMYGGAAPISLIAASCKDERCSQLRKRFGRFLVGRMNMQNLSHRVKLM